MDGTLHACRVVERLVMLLLLLLCCRTAETVGSGSLSNTRDERLGDVGLVVLDEVRGLGCK
jgi:hypothetical protein